MSFISGYDFELAVSRGLVSSHAQFRKLGQNPAVGTTDETIEYTGAALPYLPTSAVNVEVVTTGNDTAAGTGARAVIVEGLASDFTELSETVATNAGTATTTGTFIRVFSARVSSVGTIGGANENNIVVRAAIAGTTFLTIQAAKGQCSCSNYTVPAGKNLYFRDMHITVDTGKSVSIQTWTRENADDVTVPYSPARRRMIYAGVTGSIEFDYPSFFKIPAKTDLWFTGVVPSGTAEVTLEYHGILVTE